MQMLQKGTAYVGIFLATSLVLFAAAKSIPGDPSLRLKNPTPGDIAKMREMLGLEQPLPVQYLTYVRNFVTGDWGQNFVTGRSVRSEMGYYFPATLELTLTALLVGIVVGTTIIVLGNVARIRALKTAAGLLSATGLTVPIFIIGLGLVLVFSVMLGWLPGSGRVGYAFTGGDGQYVLLESVFSGNLNKLGSAIRHLVLPACCLALFPAALVSTTLQAQLDDVRTERLQTSLTARGLTPARIWIVHIAKLTGGPVVTIIGTNFGALLGGAVITETVFAWPGMGQYLVRSVLDREYFVIINGLLSVILLAAFVAMISDIIRMLFFTPPRST